jgi:hypothetical protein
LNAKVHLNQDKLKADGGDEEMENTDIVMIKETGKFVIKDLEEEEKKRSLV